MEFTTRPHGRSNIDQHVQGRLTTATSWGVQKLETTSCLSAASWPSDNLKDGLTGKSQVHINTGHSSLHDPVSRIEFTANRVCILTNHRNRNAQVNLSFSFVSCVSNHLKGHCIEFKYYADGIHSGLTPPGNNS